MSYNRLLPVVLVTALLASCSSIPNARTAEVMVNGNCTMCEETIEEAGLQQGVSEVEWDKETRKATITFDSTIASVNVVLQHIAIAGYDNELFIASDAAYADRPKCCQYKRTGTTIAPPAKGERTH